MEIKLRPTNRMHQIRPENAGDLCYARLWIGTTENGETVQALIFGLALDCDCEIRQGDVELAATPPPGDLVLAWPKTVIARNIPGAYKPLERSN